MKKLLFFLLLFPLLTIGQDKVVFTAAGITCSMCSIAIHKSLMRDTAIIEIAPNLNTQEWYVVYEPDTYTLDRLKKRVEDAGFSLAMVKVNGELVLQNKSKKPIHKHK